jgi:hypothetical protein
MNEESSLCFLEETKEFILPSGDSCSINLNKEREISQPPGEV